MNSTKLRIFRNTRANLHGAGHPHRGRVAEPRHPRAPARMLDPAVIGIAPHHAVGEHAARASIAEQDVPHVS